MGMGESGHQQPEIPARPHWPIDAVSYGTSVDSSSVGERITMAQVEEPVNESVEERSLVKKSLDGYIGGMAYLPNWPSIRREFSGR
jgi:hypothetical protein